MKTASDLIDRLEVAVRAAHTAGEILHRGVHSGAIACHAKSHPNDPVTEFDLRADCAIVDIIRAIFPHDTIVTEERGEDGVHAERRWVVDPLDGTNNFSRRLPHFAVSIAFCNGYRPLVACIHDPIRDETYTAVRGMGAFLNREPLHVSDQVGLEGAFLGVGTSSRPTLREGIHSQMPPFLRAARALRTTGSAALDLAYVAAGRFDGVWYPELHWWDVAAGFLLIEEAGGRASDYRGEPFSGAASSVVASNATIHDAILCLMSGGTDGA